MEFICPACSTRLVVNGERIRGKRVGFVCKACGTSIEVDGRSDPPGIQARERRVHPPRTSSPALAVEVPSPLEPSAPSLPPPPPSKPRRATPPPLPKRALASRGPAEPRDTDATRATDPSLPPFAEPAARPDLPPIGPSSEPSLPIGMTNVPPVELSSRASRPERASSPLLVPPGLLAAAEQARRRRVQAWLAATGLLAALLGGYGVGVLTRTPTAIPPAAVVATQPSPPPSPPPVGSAAAAVQGDSPAASAPTVISIDDLPIAKGTRARTKKRKPRARTADAKAAELDKEALVEAMRDANRAAAACSTPGGPRGTSRIAVTVAPDGRVVTSVLEGGALFGSVEARCIEEKFRAVRVPPFRGGPVTAHKTVRLQ